ncbi:MAG: hypothetical protein ACFFCQ_17365, partial [Promethearchaeota archaeon]
MSERGKHEIDLVARLTDYQEGRTSSLPPLKNSNDSIDGSYQEVEDCFESPLPFSEEIHPHRWSLGSTLSQDDAYKFTKLASIHRNISNQECIHGSRTAQRNFSLAVKLQQWFPVALLDVALAEMHRIDLTKKIGDDNALARVLGYLECTLRFRCRTIPWRVIWEINKELGVNLTKPLISEYRFKALQAGAFSTSERKRANSDTFNVLRYTIASLIPSLPVSSDEKRTITRFTKTLCAFLECQHIIPKDPEVYGHAIVVIAYKKVTGNRNLVTT